MSRRRPPRRHLHLEPLEARVTPFASAFLNALGTGGFTMNGFENGALAGQSVAGVGDVNGDGLADVIVTAPLADAGGTDRGEAYVVFGSAALAGQTMSLASPLGFTIRGFEDNAQAGGRSQLGTDTFGASGAGDVNGDGFADIIIGAGGTNSGGTDRGEAYVIFGGPTRAGSVVTLDNFGTGGFTLRGFEDNAFAGFSVNGAGDVNGDGYADVIVGSGDNDGGGTNRGEAYVVFGGPSLGSFVITLNNLGTGGFTLRGFEGSQFAGHVVAGAGDVNADGFADVIVGAPNTNAGGTDRGEAYVVFGGPSRAGTVVTLNNLGTGGFTLRGYQDNAIAGSSVNGAGDVNGDGIADVTVGAPNTDTGSIVDRGEFYVVFGGPSRAGTVATLNSLGSGGFAQTLDEAGDGYGRVVAPVGDLDGDGKAEVAVGASTDSANDSGAAVIEFRSGGYIYLGGFEANGRAGTSVRSAGDVNGDGLPDVIVSAPGHDVGGTNRGQAFVYFSPASKYIAAGAGPGRRPTVQVSDAVSGRRRLEFLAFDPTYAGGVNTAVGDVNGDDTPDIIVSMAGPVPLPATVVSRVRVFDGKTFAKIADFIPYDGFTSGMQVGVADVNGDKKADVIVSPGPGGGPHIKVLDATKLNNVNGNGVLNESSGVVLAQFFAYATAFRGGVNMSVGDINADGKPDIVTGVGSGGGPHVKVIDGTKLNQLNTDFTIKDAALLASFFAFAPSFPGGVLQAVGDVNLDGKPDLITSAGPGGGPQVNVIDGTKLNQTNPDGTISGGAFLRSFFAYDPSFTGGVRVAAVDADLDGKADIVTGAGAGGGPHVKVFRGSDAREIRGYMAFDPGFLGGVYVGAGASPAG